MKFGVIVLAVMALASVATHFLLQDNGYVLINFRGYAVEMSVPVLVFLLIVAYLAVRLLVRIWRAPRELGAATARARTRRAGRQVTNGFIALSEGKIERGERLLTKGARNSETPLLNYLAAARAAQMQGDHERRDGWLRIAYEHDSNASNAVLLTQAELQMGDGEDEQALASLNRIRETQPRHPQALKLLAKLHLRRQDWHALAELLPVLRQGRNVSVRELDEWTEAACGGLLGEPDLDQERIDKIWQSLPRSLRKSPSLIRARIQALLGAGAETAAEAEIRRALKAAWDSELVLLYGELDQMDAPAQLRHAESWLKARPDDPDVLLTAGRACVRNQLWGKARSYLESSLAIRPTPAAYRELGQLMLQVGEAESATEAFQKGLTMTRAGMPAVPRLEAK